MTFIVHSNAPYREHAKLWGGVSFGYEMDIEAGC
jgi:hypothetical protein